MIVYAIVWGCVVGIVLATTVHECGHLAGALASGLVPRVLMIGQGPTLLRRRRGNLTLVLRAFPVTGYLLSEPTDRRWAKVVTVAAGPLANLLVLCGCLGLHALEPDWDLVVAVAIFQAAFCIAALIPMTGKVAGRRSPSDGLSLYRLLRATAASATANQYAQTLAHVRPKGAPPHPTTRHTGRILFAATRPDGSLYPWARRDACVSLQVLLQADDLTAAERAYILCFLASVEILHGVTEATPETFDSWTREALALAPEPVVRATRGEALLARGEVAEADALLREALAGFAARDEGASAQAALCRASLGQAAAAAGRREEAEALLAEAESMPAAAAPQVRALLTLIKVRAMRGRAPPA